MKTNAAILLALIWISFTIAPADADTLTVEPPVYEEASDTGITIREVYNNTTGEYVGEQTTYDDGNGNTITEITTNEE